MLATQNPIELEGTYPLPEAQMDRFLFKVVMGSPKPEELREILNRTTTAKIYQPQPGAGPRACAREDRAAESAGARGDDRRAGRALRDRHNLSLARPGGPGAPPEVSQYLRFGPSPRGAQALILCAKVNALLDGRVSVSYEDIEDAIVPSLRHRLLRNFQAEAENVQLPNRSSTR